MSEIIYTKKDRDRIKRIHNKIDQWKSLIEEAEDQIEEIKAGQSPIQPGDMIEFTNRGGRSVLGRVHHIQNDYRGFTYRVHIISKITGKEVGWANVQEDHCPTLLDQVGSKRSSKSAVAQSNEVNTKC